MGAMAHGRDRQVNVVVTEGLAVVASQELADPLSTGPVWIQSGSTPVRLS